MLNFLDILQLLPFIGHNIALFSGGLFAGAAVYVSLTECPPRSVLGPREMMLLTHSIAARTDALLLVLSAATAASAIMAAMVGGGSLWMSGGLTQLGATVLLITDVQGVSKRLASLSLEEEAETGEKLLQRRAGQIAILALFGLGAQCQFILA